MKKSDVKIGMKVVPFKKTAKGWGDFKHSVVWQKAIEKGQPFLYVVSISFCDESTIAKGKIYKNTELVFALNEIKESGGDFFDASDFRPYVPKKAK